MLVLFLVYLTPGADAGQILTRETLEDTQAQLMTPADARKVGFGGLPEDMPENVRVIAANARDKRRILNALEASPIVARFSVHDVDA